VKRAPQLVSESRLPYNWVEYRGRRWLLFGERYHYWALRTAQYGGYSFEVAQFTPEHYCELETMQQAVPCKVGQSVVEDRSGDSRPEAIYWYRGRWYHVAAEFGPREIIPLINTYHADIEAAKRARQQKRSAAIRDTKRRIDPTT